MQYDLKQEGGLTLMELIIVLAVIAIIGAILIPNFRSATDRTRLKSDIQSARVIQSAIEIYNSEQSTPLAPANDVRASILKALIEKGHLSPSADKSPQTDKAVWAYGADGIVKLNISACEPKIKGEIFSTLSAEEQALITGN